MECFPWEGGRAGYKRNILPSLIVPSCTTSAIYLQITHRNVLLSTVVFCLLKKQTSNCRSSYIIQMEKRSTQGRLKPFLISFASPASCSAGVPMKMVRKHNFMIVKRWNMCFWKLAGNQTAHVEILFSPHLSSLSDRGNSYRPGLRLTFTQILEFHILNLLLE